MSKSYKREIKLALASIQMRIDSLEKEKALHIRTEVWSKVPGCEGMIVGLMIAQKDLRETLPRNERYPNKKMNHPSGNGGDFLLTYSSLR